MSDRKEKKLIPAVLAHEAEVVVGQNCDRCGVDIPAPPLYESRDFTLEFLMGSAYPEGTDLTGWEVRDCCDTCAVHLKEVLIANGFKVTEAELSF